MKRTSIFQKTSILFLLFLTGCGRLIDWGKSNFYQGEEMISFESEVKPFLRSITIYNQLETAGWFDLLWLSDEVRTAYAKLHTERMGKNEDQYKAFLRRQLEENRHYISFYILSIHEMKLGTPESHWSFFLRIKGKDYLPFELKKIDLPYEYQQFFGSYWNRFKEPYLICFRLEDENDEPIINDQTDYIALYVRSADKEHVFTWPVHEQPQETFPVIKNKKVKKIKKLAEPRKHWPRKRR